MSDDLQRRLDELVDEISPELQDEHEMKEARYRIDQEVSIEHEEIDRHIEELADAEDPEYIALLLDMLEAWLLSPYTPRFIKHKIRTVIDAKRDSL